MKSSRLLAACAVASALVVSTDAASAQLPDVTQKARGAVKAQTQAQVRQRLRAQVRQSTQVQVQSRIQADATRAAAIAQQAAVAAQQRAAATTRNQAASARQRAASGLNVRLTTGARARAGVPVANDRARARANVNSRLGLQTGLVVPPGLTRQDVEIYDNIFGRFNPLRPQPKPKAAPKQKANTPPANPESGTTPDSAAAPNSKPKPENGNRRAADRLVSVQNELSLESRINVAARQRRAEISKVRDRALVSGDTKLMLKAQQMEEALNAFARAQAKLHADARAKAQSEAQKAQPPAVNASGSANAATRVKAGGPRP